MSYEHKIWEFALENALKFNGKANQGAVVGKLMAHDPTIKSQMREVAPQIGGIIKEISAMSLDDIKAKLLEMNPDFESQQQEKKQERKAAAQELPALDVQEGSIVTRVPPEPSKYAHVGHAMSFLINYMYAKMYKGKVVLRFDDTNPEKSTQEFVDAMLDDIQKYLGMQVDGIKYASDDMDRFMQYAQQFIDNGQAYVCTLPSEEISKQRREGKACPSRENSVKKNNELWQQMLAGDLDQGVLRLKIDPAHKNAVMRDPVIYRVVKATHYRTADKYTVWPMYDFETAVEEGLLGVTHVFRSNEFDSRIELQHHIAQLLGFDKVAFKHYGRFNIVGSDTQGRVIREKIENGEYLGWDDPGLVTLRALQRRGIVKETYYRLVKQIGMSKTQTNLNFSTLAAINRQVLDEEAKRFFFVQDPIEVEIQHYEGADITLPLHPQLDLGKREMKVSSTVLLEKQDVEATAEGETIRLMDCCNIVKHGSSFALDSLTIDEFKQKGKKIIHFVDKIDNVSVEIMMPDRKILKGLGESSLQSLKVGEVIQFQRFGFARLDSIINGVFRFWFTHQ